MLVLATFSKDLFVMGTKRGRIVANSGPRTGDGHCSAQERLHIREKSEPGWGKTQLAARALEESGRAVGCRRVSSYTRSIALPGGLVKWKKVSLTFEWMTLLMNSHVVLFFTIFLSSVSGSELPSPPREWAPQCGLQRKVPTCCFSHQLGISVLPMLWSLPSWNSGAVGVAGAHELWSQTGLNPSSVVN